MSKKKGVAKRSHDDAGTVYDRRQRARIRVQRTRRFAHAVLVLAGICDTELFNFLNYFCVIGMNCVKLKSVFLSTLFLLSVEITRFADGALSILWRHCADAFAARSERIVGHVETRG